MIDPEKLKIVVERDDGHKCPRCWRYWGIPELPQGICDRCAQAILSSQLEDFPDVLDKISESRYNVIMAITKALGRDIKDFFDNGWPKGFYVDDYTLSVYEEDGITCALDLNEKYAVNQFGYLFPDGGDTGKEISFQTAFNKWLASRDFDTITIRVAKADKETITANLKTLGYQII